MTSLGISANGRGSTGTPWTAPGAAPRPLSCGFWPSRCWIRSDVGDRQVAVVALELLGQRRPADPADRP